MLKSFSSPIIISAMAWTQFFVTKANNEGIKSLIPNLLYTLQRFG